MKRNEGITMIALIVTIVVLLILAGITIGAITGNNGLIGQTQEAKEQTEIGEEKELRRLTALEAATNLEEHEFEDSNGEKVIIPAECAVSQVEGENTLEDGLVIIDKNENEWVWIEVSKSKMPENLNFESNEDYTILETALQNYANDYRIDGYTDEYYEGCGLEERDYTILKQNMLKSIYENGGFFIGRYEVGTFDLPVTNNDTRTAVIQEGAYPYNYITCSQAQKLSERLSIGGKKSSLMFGIQWDLIMKFLESKGVSQSELKVDSSDWGNYNNSLYSINKKAQYSMNQGNTWNGYPYTKNEDKEIILTTGAVNKNKKLNIFDLAGNLWEFTLEYSNNPAIPVSFRGGRSYDKGSLTPVYKRNCYLVDHSSYDLTFRVFLY